MIPDEVYCPICRDEPITGGGYTCEECGETMCELCFGDPAYTVCRACRKKLQLEDGE